MDFLVLILVGVVIGLVLLVFWQASSASTPIEVAKFKVGEITLETLSTYSGYDYTKPILVAVNRVVYDVTKHAHKFGPGKELHMYAGQEISRALAKGSREKEDLGSGQLHDLGAEQVERLQAAVTEMNSDYDVVGEIVDMKEISLEDLGKHSGHDPSRPMYLSILGTVYDITRGKNFYGPDGMYPFAGKECARALALMSTDLADCNDNVSDLQYMERENLREWQAKFNSKYPIVGRIVPTPPAKTE